MAISKDPIVISRLVQRDHKRIWISALIVVHLQAAALASAYLSWSRYGGAVKESSVDSITAEVIFQEESPKIEEQHNTPIFEEEIQITEEIEAQQPVFLSAAQEQEDDMIAPVTTESSQQDAFLLSATNVPIIYRPAPLQTKPKPKPTPVKPKAKTSSGTKKTQSQSISKKGKGRCRFPNIQITRSDKKKIKRQVLVRVYTNKQGKITKVVLLRSSGYKAFDQKFIRAVRRSRCPQGNRHYDLAPTYG